MYRAFTTRTLTHSFSLEDRFMEEITQTELEERVALLRKFRTLLEQQRKKFQEYLTVLEKQEHSIETEDAESLAAHTELEQSIVSGIANLQKVIVPFSELYKAASPALSADEQRNVAAIQDDLARLQTKVLAQNEKNRERLKAHLVQIRQQLDDFKNPYRNISSVYAKKVAQGNLVTVEV